VPDPERTFYMSFTQRPFDVGAEAIEDTFALIGAHSDMWAFQFDEGVPWPEAFAAQEFSPEYRGYLSLQEAVLEEDSVVYLALCALNPGRDGLALYRGVEGNMELPAPWDEFGFGFPDAVLAYTNYCLRMIDRFSPKYLNYGIEATELILQNPGLWDLYVDFNARVYSAIKERHPGLMLGLSVSLRHPGAEESANIRKAVADLRPYMDFQGVSVYPYVFYGPLVTGDPATLQPRWLYQAVDMARGLPVAIAETAWPAEPLSLPDFGVSVDASPERQDAYVRRLLNAAQEIDALFVVWFTVADYDKLLAAFPEDAQDSGRIWRDTGLYDEELVPRLSLGSWDAWLATGPGPAR
jgi:hypothetical protein